MKLHCTTERSV